MFPLVPWIYETESHSVAAFGGTLLGFLFGVLILISAYPDRYTTHGREAISFGACCLIGGILFLIFGLWLAIPILAIIACSVLYIVIMSLWSLTGR